MDEQVKGSVTLHADEATETVTVVKSEGGITQMSEMEKALLAALCEIHGFAVEVGAGLSDPIEKICARHGLKVQFTPLQTNRTIQ